MVHDRVQNVKGINVSETFSFVAPPSGINFAIIYTIHIIAMRCPCQWPLHLREHSKLLDVFRVDLENIQTNAVKSVSETISNISHA